MRFLFTFASALCLAGAFAQKTDTHLQDKLQEMVKDFKGNAGIYVLDLQRNRIAAVNADTIYPTASLVKLPILVGIMHKINQGELQYHQVMTYADSLYYSEGEDILASFKTNEKISLSKLLMLMLSTSDNTASLWLQRLAGTGTAINRQLDSLGLQITRVNSRTPGREANRSQYGWGQTTPREMVWLMQYIVQGQIVSKSISERMLRLLGREYWDEQALSQIPPNLFVASKSGALDETRNEVLYVNAKHPYVFCICTKNNADKSWNAGNEAWVLIRNLSAALYRYFNPKYPYIPPTVLQ
jgi:beta-lactamase class A